MLRSSVGCCVYALCPALSLTLLLKAVLTGVSTTADRLDLSKPLTHVPSFSTLLSTPSPNPRFSPLPQINFDLLSELVKFNPAMFARLNRLLDGSRFDRFMAVVTEHLVDTNVFIRSLVLSLQSFRHGVPAPPYLGVVSSDQVGFCHLITLSFFAQITPLLRPQTLCYKPHAKPAVLWCSFWSPGTVDSD